MSRSMVDELKAKMLHSGSRLNLFIGINIIVFLVIGILKLVSFLGISPALAAIAVENLRLPAYLPALLVKPWTLLTYMFTHLEFFHFLFNMLWLYWMGRIFEEFLNNRQFTFTYLAGGFAGAFLYILFYNVFPVYQDDLPLARMHGASAGVMAIIVATATLLPDYEIRLLLIGGVRLKYLALVYIVLDVIGIAGANSGGSLAHLGGALLGFVFIKRLQAGSDWSKLFNREKRFKVIRNEPAKSSTSYSALPDQEVIDRILDKISKSGYDSLSKQEKEQLFRASNKK
ncbi:rhomboid family intramembrane serine protease [Pedobacter sp. SYSU D00535]|uniref:rhomboid family intramembrane serine protease n=1 Tax=Pedobacter sp. SYSU D00535 TaxID=2810308 RepID=UPI001A96D931|nr:rhomboid family intramembrane serine protease [Pedobacter sp. SYSU D00535]